MPTPEELKDLVRTKYAEIACQPASDNAASCCGSGPVSYKVYNIMMDDYTGMDGYNADADLGLGCGLPTAFAGIERGHTVVDLGSGAGNDCFVARAEAGPTGKVIGVDFTPAMIEKARAKRTAWATTTSNSVWATSRRCRWPTTWRTWWSATAF